MKTPIILLISLALCSCSKDFVNTCDSKGEAFLLPKAAFTSTKNGASVSFSNTSEFAENYTWDFGDGTTSTETNPTKTYPQDKSYTVKLTAKRCVELVAEANETIDMKCDASSPVVVGPQSLKLCQGETVTISASCSSGTVIWSNKSTLPTQTISSNESIFVQCTKNGCFSTKSTVYNFEVNQRPVAPTISATSSSVCKGSSTTISSSSCNIGVLNWSNLQTESSIIVSPTSNTTYSAICNLEGCKSLPSNQVNIKVSTATSVKTLAQTSSLIGGKASLVLNGELNFNSTDGKGQAEDHGFIYAFGTTDPKGNKNAILESMGPKSESSGKAFSHTLASSQVTYRAFVKTCNGGTEYGSLITTK
jgi:PKD repeat protein